MLSMSLIDLPSGGVKRQKLMSSVLTGDAMSTILRHCASLSTILRHNTLLDSFSVKRKIVYPSTRSFDSFHAKNPDSWY